MNYVDHVYEIIKLDSRDLDTISMYQDYIIHQVGVSGFNALYENKLLENYGVINGRQLYVLCDK